VTKVSSAPRKLTQAEEIEIIERLAHRDNVYRDLTFREMIRALRDQRREAKQAKHEARRSAA